MGKVVLNAITKKRLAAEKARLNPKKVDGRKGYAKQHSRQRTMAQQRKGDHWYINCRKALARMPHLIKDLEEMFELIDPSTERLYIYDFQVQLAGKTFLLQVDYDYPTVPASSKQRARVEARTKFAEDEGYAFILLPKYSDVTAFSIRIKQALSAAGVQAFGYRGARTIYQK